MDIRHGVGNADVHHGAHAIRGGGVGQEQTLRARLRVPPPNSHGLLTRELHVVLEHGVLSPVGAERVGN